MSSIFEIIQNLNFKWHNKYGLDVQLVPIHQGMQAHIGYKGAKFVVRIYPSGGDVKVDFSQVKNSIVKRDLQAMLDGTYVPDDSPIYESSRPDVVVAGFDESGKGDVFGGLITAGYCLPQPYDIASNILMSIGVKDSKELTDHDIVEISNVLTRLEGAVVVKQYMIPSEFNRLQSEGLSTNDIMKDPHMENMNTMMELCDTPPNVLLIDQFCEEEWLQGRLLCGMEIKQGDDLRYRVNQQVIEQMPKGESNLLVAAASIIARRELLDQFDGMSIEWGKEFPKGANKNVSNFYHKFIEPNYDKDTINKMMKTSFHI